MDVLAALLACSLYPADDALVRALAESNSHGNPYFVFDPTLDPSRGEPPPDPHSLAEALERTASVEAKQATPLLGLLELPPAWLAEFGRSRADAFDACTNIAIGTAWLSTFESECARASGRPGPRPDSRVAIEQRACILERYAGALRMPDLPAIVGLELRARKFPATVFYDAPIFAVPSPRGWGPDRIFTALTLEIPQRLDAQAGRWARGALGRE